MIVRTVAACACSLLLTLSACSGSDSTSGPAPAEVTPPVEASGVYEVTGVTIDSETGLSRPIYGRIQLVEAGGDYTAHYELSTLFPGSQAAAATVIGTGQGRLEGGHLEGTADTQLVEASVPGVDVGFAYVPREVGRRVVSMASGDFFADGTVRLTIENEAAAGAEYRPTRTLLVGYRSEDSRRAASVGESDR